MFRGVLPCMSRNAHKKGKKDANNEKKTSNTFVRRQGAANCPPENGATNRLGATDYCSHKRKPSKNSTLTATARKTNRNERQHYDGEKKVALSVRAGIPKEAPELPCSGSPARRLEEER